MNRNPVIRSDDMEQDRPLRIGVLAGTKDALENWQLAILDRIEQRRYDVLTARPALTKRTKLALLLRAVSAMAWRRLTGSVAGERGHGPAVSSSSRPAKSGVQPPC